MPAVDAKDLVARLGKRQRRADQTADEQVVSRRDEDGGEDDEGESGSKGALFLTCQYVQERNGERERREKDRKKRTISDGFLME